jgi:pimeloyl-ACP methyl ester carboxylesterase
MMAGEFSGLEKQVRGLRHWLPTGSHNPRKPVVILLHGLGGDRNDWINPFQERNWPYDHQRVPAAVDLGVHSWPPVGRLPGLEARYHLSPRLVANSRGIDGSDDRSWWHALAEAGFPIFTYSQVGSLMLPLEGGPVAEFTRFMHTLQQDVLNDSAHKLRSVVIVGHSRGGLVGRAFLGSPHFKAARSVLLPRVHGLITLSSPHQGSHMALMDDKIISFLDKVEKVVPKLPNDVGKEAIRALKQKVDDYVGPHGDEIEPNSPLFRALEAQEPIQPGVRCISVGGASPRLLRIYLWRFTVGSMVPRGASRWKLDFHWRAKAVEAKAVSPVFEGLPLKVLGMDVDEIVAGLGDGLTAEKRCRFPASFDAEEHLVAQLSHGEMLWDAGLQAEVVKRLETF